MNILKQYIKLGKTIIGDDNLELDTPTFEILNIEIDTINKILKVKIHHKVQQGKVTQQHTRTVKVNFDDLPNAVKTTGKTFLDDIEQEILKLPQYTGSKSV